VTKEEAELVPYDPLWPEVFERERRHRLSGLNAYLVRKIEHFGSTAIPGMLSKPIVDTLVEVASLDKTRRSRAPVLEAQGYDYFWHPSGGDNTPPFYAWFIKRDPSVRRTRHLHMVEAHFEHFNGLKVTFPAACSAKQGP